MISIKNKVRIIDAAPGSGKTTWLLNSIKSGDFENPLVVVVPYITEINRIQAKIPDFKTPEAYSEGNMSDSFTELLACGEPRIVITHELLKRIQPEALDYIELYNYDCVIDEAIDAIDTIKVRKGSFYDLLVETGAVSIDPESNQVTWNELFDKDYESSFNELRSACRTGQVFLLSDSRASSKQSLLFWEYPRGMFERFNQMLVMTYLFEGTLMKPYFKINDIPYEVLDNAKLGLMDEQEAIAKLKARIKISYHGKNNNVGQAKDYVRNPLTDSTLSSSWFRAKKNWALHQNIAKSFYNVARKDWELSKDETVLVTYEHARESCTHKDYKPEHIACNLRATNDYAHIRGIGYLINRYVDPTILAHIRERGAKFNSDWYSLSEMIQTLFRGCIRNPEGGDMHVFVPSIRMRTLLENWLNGDYIRKPIIESVAA